VERPDIVIFLADDLTVDDLTIYDGKGIPTPNCDRIAKEGMTFDRAYVTSPSCAPSRAALLTGRFGAHTGALFNHQKVRPDVAKWPSFFKKLGYEVVAFGKVSHYNHVLDYGFDHADFFGYHEDICVTKAVEWLDARKSDKPLCLIVGTNWPHVPWPQREAREPEAVDLRHKLADTPQTRKAVARYETAVKRMDQDLGEVWDAMKRRLPEDTMFLFTADHGAQFPFEKWNLYEPSLRTPLVVVWPGHVKPGSRSDAMVSWVDILPTVLEIAGANPRAVNADFDGRSFLPVLLGKTAAHRESVYAAHSGDGKMNFYPSRAVVGQRWKYIRNLDPALEFHTHIDRAHQDTGYWPSWVEKAKTDPATAELVEKYHKRPAEELYDLEKDPEERNNLAGNPGAATELARMRRELDKWMRSLGDRGMATDEAVRPKNSR
jgi:Arylsulfatase A and related enzymes